MSRKTRVDGWREEQDREPGPAEQTTNAGEVPTTGFVSVPNTLGEDPLNWSGQLHNTDEVRPDPHVL